MYSGGFGGQDTRQSPSSTILKTPADPLAWLAKAGATEAVDAIDSDMEHNLLQLQTELCDQTYRPGPYDNFYIHELKRRLVSAGFSSFTQWE